MIVLASASCPGVASFLPFCWKNTNESTVYVKAFDVPGAAAQI